MECSRFRISLLLTLCLASSGLVAQSYGELINEALQLRNRGEFAEAEILLRKAHTSVEDQRESYYLLGMTVAFQDRFEEAQEILNEALERYPGDLTLLISRARVLSYQGDFSTAQSTVDQVLELSPANTEALNLSGRISLYQNQPTRAIERFSRTLSIDTNNLEAQVGMHDAYRNLADEDQAAQWLELAAAQAPENFDVQTRLEWSADPDPSWQVTYGYGNSRFKRIPLSDWYDSFIEAHRQNGRGSDLYARVENQGHFGMSDTLLAVGTVRNMNGSKPWGAKLEYSPDAFFVPEYRIGLFISPKLREGEELLGPTIATISAQHSSYPTAAVSQLGLGLDQYLFNGRVWLTPSISTVLDENDDLITGWNLHANFLLNEKFRFGLGYGESPETQNATTVITRTAHLYGHATLTDHADIRVDLVQEDRDNSYLRYGATIALIWKY